ncbi:MAG: glycosyltransferase family A protein [Actinobacteria bacterium]|nr:glycosyltransferase family A protein [Actinomycetota bacterium]
MSRNVAVIIPAYNAAETLASTIQSALQPEVEQIVVVDDGSTDATAEIIRTIAATTPQIQAIFRPVSGGPAQARNDGLATTTSEFVLFLDSDDRLQPGAIATLQRAAAPTSAAVLGRFVAVDTFDSPIDIGTWATVQLQPVVRRGGHLVPSAELSGEALLTRLVVPPPGGILVRRLSPATGISQSVRTTFFATAAIHSSVHKRRRPVGGGGSERWL